MHFISESYYLILRNGMDATVAPSGTTRQDKEFNALPQMVNSFLFSKSSKTVTYISSCLLPM